MKFINQFPLFPNLEILSYSDRPSISSINSCDMIIKIGSQQEKLWYFFTALLTYSTHRLSYSAPCILKISIAFLLQKTKIWAYFVYLHAINFFKIRLFDLFKKTENVSLTYVLISR